MSEQVPTYSESHPHEPAIPPALDAEGRCLVCGLELRAEQAEAERDALSVRLAQAERKAARLEALLESTKPYLWNGLGEPPHIWDLVVAASGGREAPDTKEP